jgi:ubiquitin C-terminal hydrolase
MISSAIIPDESFTETFMRFRANCTSEGMGTNTQEDAMEFLNFLLDVLHEDLVGESLCLQRKEVVVEDDGWSEVPIKSKRAVVDDAGRLKSLEQVQATPVRALFDGVFRSEVFYIKKRVQSITFQRFNYIPLQLQAGKVRGVVDLMQALSANFKEEDLSSQGIKKTTLLEACPRILVLQLIRFAFDVFEGTTSKVMNVLHLQFCRYSHVICLD